MGFISKTPKGEIKVDNFRGRIRLRWTHEGERYPLGLPYDYAPENMHHATIKIAEIELDILKGCFDTTLEKYRPVKKQAVKKQKEDLKPLHSFKYLNQLAEKFIEWTTNIKNINIDHSIDYYGVSRVLISLVGIPIKDVPAQLQGKDWCVNTYNKRVTILSSFFSWLKDSGYITINPLLHVSKKRNKGKGNNPRREPLTEVEISTFLDAIKNDTHCSKYAPVKHSYYYPFLKFIFLSGVRNAEAIGLKIRHIDFTAGQIEISEALARTNKGTHHAARISKGTKTENVRYLPLPDEIRDLLMPLIYGREPDALVFLSPKGLSVDDRMLQRRIVRPVLKELGYRKRDLYTARGAMSTRAIEQGIPITEVAYLLGHASIQTTISNYVSVSKPAVSLPSLKKQGK